MEGIKVQTLFGVEETTGAMFSKDRQHRYALWRNWDELKPQIMFIGLNPSTASEQQDDPTIRQVIKFAKRFGYGGIVMCNLFAYVSKDPEDLLVPGRDLQGANDTCLRHYGVECEDILFAWGAFKQAKKRAAEVQNIFTNAFCLGQTADGSPKHPLYLKADTKLQKFRY